MQSKTFLDVDYTSELEKNQIGEKEEEKEGTWKEKVLYFIYHIMRLLKI